MKLKFILLTCFLAFLCHSFSSYAQSNGTKPLSIGDTMPHIILTDVVNHPVSKIQLSQLKGKLVILDFWGKYCRSCLAAFPKLDSLQRRYNSQVQIVSISDIENKEELLATLAKYPFTKDLQLTASTHHRELAAMFPHELVSHVVWINKQGVVAAVTGADYVTGEHITELFNRDVVDWPVKKDRLEFNYRQPLLALGQADLPVPQFLYYSTLTANMPGISAPNGITRDSAKGIAMTMYYNATLLSLCEIALGHPPANKIVLDVNDPARFYWTKNGLYSDWFRANTFCYALLLPLHFSNEEIKQAVRADLLRWLSVLGIKITESKKIEAGKEVNSYLISDKQ